MVNFHIVVIWLADYSCFYKTIELVSIIFSLFQTFWVLGGYKLDTVDLETL